MFDVTAGSPDGLRVQGEGGRRFAHDVDEKEQHHTPFVDLQFESDKRRGVWSRTMRVKLDTGADSNYMHDSFLDMLGLRPGTVVGEPVNTAGKNEKIPVRRKLVWVRVVGFEDYRFPIRIAHSVDFRENFLNLGLGALAPHYGVVLTESHTLLFPK